MAEEDALLKQLEQKSLIEEQIESNNYNLEEVEKQMRTQSKSKFDIICEKLVEMDIKIKKGQFEVNSMFDKTQFEASGHK